MHRPVMTAAVLVAAAVAVTLTPTASSAAVPYLGANTPKVQDDFNGDGYRDLAIGMPYADNGSAELAGAVVVLYGSRSSVSMTRRTVITQATTGVAGVPEWGDEFGSTVATADLDRDGYADLIVGSPAEDIGGRDRRGAVTVVWGGPKGLQTSTELPLPAGFGQDRVYCGFGGSLATGDMNRDGAPELSVGTHCDGVTYTGPFRRDGRPAAMALRTGMGDVRSVVMGDVNGDGTAERFWLNGSATGTVFTDAEDPLTGVGIPLPLAQGQTGVIGDVNGDGYGDLVTGRPDDEYMTSGPGAAYRGGEIQVLYGSRQGIDPAQRPKVLHQDTAGVPGGGEMGDMFGQSLSIGNANGDRYADVLVGVPGEALGTRTAAGNAILLPGSATGPATAGSTGYTQDTPGVPDGGETYDMFGSAVHLIDLDRDGRAEAVAGVPGENNDGCVWVARGGTSGPVLSGSVNLCGKTAGLGSSSNQGWFGGALAGAHLLR